MLIKRDVYYAPAGQTRKLHILLPEGYEAGEERYPVMYFFDGHNLFRDEDATYGKSWGLETYLRAWDKRLIIVGAECSHEGNARLSEYLPYEVYRGWLSGTEPLGEATMRWLMEEVKPMIDAEYRTIPFRECTGIGGSSMGGLMAAFAVVRWNHLISKAACVSPALTPCAPALWREMNGHPTDPDTRVFLSWGTREAPGIDNPDEEDRSSGTYRRIRATANKIEAAGGAAYAYCQIGGRHCEADWERQLPLFMPFLWQA